MRTLFYACILLFFTLTNVLKASTSETDKLTGSISGSVSDQETKQPVPFATVALYKDNDTTNIVKGIVTNEDGQFSFSDVIIGNYDIKVSYVGYHPIIVRGINLDRKNLAIKLDNMSLEESMNSINEVVVVQERLKGEQQIDKTVFTINDQVRTSSSSGLDLLKHIPSVSVDFQENVTLEGQSDILFFVDGIERNKDFIAQLDPKLIDKVEIITNPGVKYKADISGVINIVLVKEPRHGINGSVKIDIPHPETILLNPRANIEYGNQHFRTYLGYRSHLEKFNGHSFFEKNVNDTETPYYIEIDGNGENMWVNQNLNYGFDWFINNNNSLNFYTEWKNFNGSEKNYQFKESTFINDSLTDYQINNKSSDNGGSSLFYSLFYKKKFNDKGNELTLEANLYDYNGGHEADFNYTEYDPDDITSVLSNKRNVETVKNNKNNAEFKTDYTHIYKNLKQEIGYRAYYQWMNNEKTVTTQTGTEKFEYYEIRNTGYYSLTGSIKKLTLQGGLRYENSIFRLPEEDDINFDIFLPQFKASYKLNESQSLALSFRKQVYRPNIHDLNPFEVFIDSTLIRKGNPDLQPAIDNKAELSYSVNFKNNYISPKLYFLYNNNGIAEYSVIQNGITYVYQDNIMDRYEYGMSLNGAIQIHKMWRINFYGACFNRIIENEGLHADKISWRTHSTNIFMLPKDFVITFMFHYNSPNINYQRINSREALYIIGFEKNISKKAKIGGFYNPFIKDFTYQKVETTYGNNHEIWEGILDIRNVFTIEFTYNFNYGKKVKKINRSTEYEQVESGGIM